MFERYRDAKALGPEPLRMAVAESLRADPRTAHFEARDVVRIVGELQTEGIGVVPPGVVNADGFRQGLATTLAVLLRLAGANLAAIKAEIATRDNEGLEKLAQAVLTRLGASAPPRVEPAPAPTPSAPAPSPSAPSAQGSPMAGTARGAASGHPPTGRPNGAPLGDVADRTRLGTPGNESWPTSAMSQLPLTDGWDGFADGPDIRATQAPSALSGLSDGSANNPAHNYLKQVRNELHGAAPVPTGLSLPATPIGRLSGNGDSAATMLKESRLTQKALEEARARAFGGAAAAPAAAPSAAAPSPVAPAGLPPAAASVPTSTPVGNRSNSVMIQALEPGAAVPRPPSGSTPAAPPSSPLPASAPAPQGSAMGSAAAPVHSPAVASPAAPPIARPDPAMVPARRPGSESWPVSAPAAAMGAIQPVSWMRISLMDGLELHVRSDMIPGRIAEISSDDLARAVREALGTLGPRRQR